MSGYCEHGNEPSGSIKREEFIDYLKTNYLLKKDPELQNLVSHSMAQASYNEPLRECEATERVSS